VRCFYGCTFALWYTAVVFGFLRRVFWRRRRPRKTEPPLHPGHFFARLVAAAPARLPIAHGTRRMPGRLAVVESYGGRHVSYCLPIARLAKVMLIRLYGKPWGAGVV
jgi:hypothetical protein